MTGNTKEEEQDLMKYGAGNRRPAEEDAAANSPRRFEAPEMKKLRPFTQNH